MRNLAKTAAALLSAALLCLSGCSVSFVNLGGGVHYQHTESYTAGDREITEPITALDIEWPSGSVRVSAVSGSTVTIKETTDADLDDDLKVHSWTDGGVLRVRFCKSGVSYRKSAKKTLEITVPEDTVFEKCVCRRQNRTDTDLEPHLAGLRTALCRSRTALERKPA